MDGVVSIWESVCLAGNVTISVCVVSLNSVKGGTKRLCAWTMFETRKKKGSNKLEIDIVCFKEIVVTTWK
jgi:hypothetical protein